MILLDNGLATAEPGQPLSKHPKPIVPNASPEPSTQSINQHNITERTMAPRFPATRAVCACVGGGGGEAEGVQGMRDVRARL